jgi:hypothetical protein
MKQAKLIALFESGMFAAVIGVTLIAFPSKSANAQQPLGQGAVPFPRSNITALKGNICCMAGLAVT